MKSEDILSIEPINADDVKMEEIPNTEGIFIQWLIADKEGSKRIHLRRFTLKPGAKMTYHVHDNCEHLQYYLKGKSKVRLGEHEKYLCPGDALFIPSGVPHLYENIGEEDLQFLCIVPAIEIETKFIPE